MLPAIAVWRELRQNQFLALRWSGPSLDIATHVLWHKDKWISPAMAAFLEIVKGNLDEDERAIPERPQATNLRSPRRHK